MGKFVIEIAGPKDENWACPLAGGTVRGRWSSHHTAYADKSEAMKAMSVVPHIPGVHIWLDVKARKAGISDPLRETEEGRRIWGQVKAILDRFPLAFGGSQVPSVSIESVVERIERSDLSLDDCKEWLWQMRCALDAGLAQVVPGSDPIPSSEQIRALPGRRRADPWNTGRTDEKLSSWADVVEVPKSSGVAVAGAA